MAVSKFSPVFPLVVLRIEVDVVVALPIPHFLQQTNRAPLVPSAKFILDLATQLHNARIDLIKNSKLPQHLRPMSQLLHHRMTRRGTLIYTSATHRMTSDLGNLNLQTYDYTGQDQVIVSNGKGSNIHHVGSFYFFSSSKSLFLKNILHVPRIKKNLILVYQFTRITMCILNFSHPFSVSRIDPRDPSYLKARVTMVFTHYNSSQSFLSTLLLLFSMFRPILINVIIVLAIFLSSLFRTFYLNTI
jgi:hypothetical protein